MEGQDLQVRSLEKRTRNPEWGLRVVIAGWLLTLVFMVVVGWA
jgi:hypothetical protein